MSIRRTLAAVCHPMVAALCVLALSLGAVAVVAGALLVAAGLVLIDWSGEEAR